ncbi:MAG TPA: hemerythrin domain-containing protein [Planctomycetota bacterium]|nr:hemerythrin domain-containing protein [Planctomycetota bacterium]
MADTKQFPKLKATSLLNEDHKKVKRLFAQFETLQESDDAGLVGIYEKVDKELRLHAQIEEEIFYPAVNNAQEEKAEGLVLEAREEHKIVKTLLDELSELEADDPEFCAKMKVLKESVLHHSEEEEREIFPVFYTLDRSVQDDVSERLNRRKRELSLDE